MATVTAGKEARLTEQLAAQAHRTPGPQPDKADSSEGITSAKAAAAAQQA
jgi:hypothetical protein